MLWNRKKTPEPSTVQEVIPIMGRWISRPADGEPLNAEAVALGIVPSYLDEDISTNLNGRSWLPVYADQIQHVSNRLFLR